MAKAKPPAPTLPLTLTPPTSVETSLAELLKRPALGPRFGYVTDIHARNRAPKNRLDDYRTVVLEKLSWVMDALASLGAVPMLVSGGDNFDVPVPSLEVADEIIDLILTKGYVMYSIFGNHDLESALATAPRTVLGHLMRRASNAIRPLPMLSSEAPLEIAGMHLWGHHYRYGNYDERLDTPIKSATAKRVVISHSMILKDTPIFEDYRLFADVETNADLILLGHYHPMQAMTQLTNAYGTLIGGPGAMMRGALSRDDLTRKPSFALVEWDQTNDRLLVDFVPIEVAKPADEVFRLVQAQEEARKNEHLEAFRADLDNLKVQHLNVAGIIEAISLTDAVPEAVKEEALRRIGVIA